MLSSGALVAQKTRKHLPGGVYDRAGYVVVLRDEVATHYVDDAPASVLECAECDAADDAEAD